MSATPSSGPAARRPPVDPGSARALRREGFAQGLDAVRGVMKLLRQQRNYALASATVFAAVGIALTADPVILTAMATGIVAYLAAIYMLQRGLAGLRALRGGGGDTRAYLRAALAITEETLRLNRWWNLLGTPLLTTAGFAVGVTQRADLSLAEMMARPYFAWVSLPSLVVLALAMRWVGAWYNERIYGPHVARLREALRRLDAGV